MKKVPAAIRMSKMLAHLQANPAGATSRELAVAIDCTWRRTMDIATKLTKAGSIVSMPNPGITDHRTNRYYAPEHAPAVPHRRAKQRTAAPSRAFEGEAFTTPDTVITIAPPFVDRRFKFDPPPGWKGQITLDHEKERGL